MSLPRQIINQFETAQFGETERSLGDKIFYGSAATLLSAVNSIYNSVTWYGSWLGMDTEPEDTADWIRNSINDDAAKYYMENKSSFDTAGFLVGSVGLGFGAAGLIKAAQLGKWGQGMQRATGIFSSKRNDLLKEAAAEYNRGALSVSSQLDAAKIKAFAYGLGDNAIQSLAIESLIVATMHQSPFMADWEVSDFVGNMTIGTIAGGVLGGVLDHLKTSKFFKEVQATRAKAVKDWEPGGILSDGSFTTGDRITSLVQHIDNLPPVPTSEFESARTALKTKTEQTSWQIAQKLANDMAGGNALLGKSLIDSVQEARAKGANTSSLYDLFTNAARIRGVTLDDAYKPEIVYFKKTGSAATLPTSFADIVSSSPIPGQTPIPYKIARNKKPAVGFVGIGDVSSVSTGFKNGLDVVIDEKGITHINNSSKVLSRAPQPGEKTIFSNAIERARAATGTLAPKVIQEDLQLADVIVDLRTGEITETAFAGFGDLFQSGSTQSKYKLTLTGDKKQLYYGPGKLLADENSPGIFSRDFLSSPEITNFEHLTNGGDYMAAHARWGLAQMTKTPAKDTVNIADLPMLTRAVQTIKQLAQESADPEATYLFAKTLKFIDLDGSMRNFSKVNMEEKLLDMVEESFKTHVDSFLNMGLPIHQIEKLLNYPINKLKTADFSRTSIKEAFFESPQDVLKPRYAKISYNVGNVIDSNTGMMLRGLMAVEEKIALQRRNADAYFASYAGPIAEQFPPMDPTNVRSEAVPTKASAGAFTSADGGYDLKGIVQFIGSLTNKLKKDFLKKDAETLAYGGANALIDNAKASAEVNILLHAIQRTDKKYVLAQVPVITGGNSVVKSVMIEESLAAHMNNLLATTTRDFVKKPFDISELTQGYPFKQLEKEGFTLNPASEGYRPWFFFENAETEQFIKTWQSITSEFADGVNSSLIATGKAPKLNTNHLYAPPPDLKKYPHVVFIRNLQGNIMGDSAVGTITARTERELREKIARVDQTKFSVITKEDHKKYFEARGEYDYNLMINDPETNSFLRREGMLANYYPNLSASEMLGNLTDYMARQRTILTRRFVEIKYGQEFTELQSLSKAHTELALSKAKNTAKGAELSVQDPYLSYIKTALDMSNINEHPLWSAVQDKTNQFLAPAFNKARELLLAATESFGKVKSGNAVHITFEEANDLTERAGLGRVYEHVANGLDLHSAFKAANGKAYDHAIVSKWVSVANQVVINLALRLDHANALINSVSMPILMVPEVKSIFRNIDKPEVAGQLGEALSWQVANTGLKVPSATKLYFGAVKKLLDPADGPALRQYFEDIGIVTKDVKDYYNILDDLAIHGNETMDALKQMTTSLVDKAAKYFLSDKAEHMNRMVSATVMKQITDMAGIEPKLAAAYINTFVSRINGVRVASQRPLAFQGPVGQAMGLFQSYQFNLLQNVFRHFMNDGPAPVAMLMGLQSTIFGIQSLPAFQAVNQHLIGNGFGNKEHKDMYSFLPSLLPNDIAETIMYGGVGWFSDAALYTRGDINPRNITILPLDPRDWVAVSAFGKVVDNMVNFGTNLVKGAGLGNSILFALEHNGLSRPLTGLVQTTQGYSTTSKGSLIQANHDVISIATAARLIGSKPLDEAIAMDANYRMVSYRAHDIELRRELSRIIKLKLLAGEEPTSEDWGEFSYKYARAGGTMEGFNSFVNDIIKNYAEPVANKEMLKLNTPYSRRMWEIMGGEGLKSMVDNEAFSTQ